MDSIFGSQEESRVMKTAVLDSILGSQEELRVVKEAMLRHLLEQLPNGAPPADTPEEKEARDKLYQAWQEEIRRAAERQPGPAIAADASLRATQDVIMRQIIGSISVHRLEPMDIEPPPAEPAPGTNTVTSYVTLYTGAITQRQPPPALARPYAPVVPLERNSEGLVFDQGRNTWVRPADHPHYLGRVARLPEEGIPRDQAQSHEEWLAETRFPQVTPVPVPDQDKTRAEPTAAELD